MLFRSVCARHTPGFIEKKREGVGVLFNVLLALVQPVDLLGRNEDDARVALSELVVSRLELSQLIRAVWSPGTADEYQHERPSAIV